MARRLRYKPKWICGHRGFGQHCHKCATPFLYIDGGRYEIPNPDFKKTLVTVKAKPAVK